MVQLLLRVFVPGVVGVLVVEDHIRGWYRLFLMHPILILSILCVK